MCYYDYMINDCGIPNPKTHSYIDPDYFNVETTIDQQEIEEVLFTICSKSTEKSKQWRILHVGTGNSLFAVRFSPLVKEIIGITISKKELRVAEEKYLPNYKVYICNKYSDDLPEMIKGKFDIIVDNNPLSFSCCWTHYRKYLSRLARYLSLKGIWFSHVIGLGYLREQENKRGNLEDWLNKYNVFQFKNDLSFTGLIVESSKLNESVLLIKNE